jgi:hypothetical protein
MQRHQLGQIIEDEFMLIAIHGNIEDYKLAFLINKHLNFNLKRKENDLDFFKKEGHITFSVFEHQNKERDDIFYLISNICKSFSEKVTSAGSLFETSNEEKTHYLIPEFKTAEYFLKIVSDEPEFYEQKLVSQLNKIPSIITTYQVDLNNLKSKNNLNFD